MTDPITKAAITAASIPKQEQDKYKWLVKHEGLNRKQRLAMAAKARKAKK